MKNRHVQSQSAESQVILRALQDSLQFCKEKGLDMLLLNLDLEKVYDRVIHDFLFKVLSMMVFLGKQSDRLEFYMSKWKVEF